MVALAAINGNNPAVQSFGALMSTEHTQAQTVLKNVGASVNITVNDSIDPVHAALMTRLNSLSGGSFDTAYINSQVMDHQNTLTLFQREISSGNNVTVKNYANQYLPHIQMHLSKADSIKAIL
jgi:putative membrane protein